MCCYSSSQVPSPFPDSGPGSFPGGTPVSGPMSLLGGYPTSPVTGPAGRTPGQGCPLPEPGLGYPSSLRARLGYPPPPPRGGGGTGYAAGSTSRAIFSSRTFFFQSDFCPVKINIFFFAGIWM